MHCIYPSLRLAPCELVAVATRHPETAAVPARMYGAPSTYTDYREMLANEELDAVFCVGGEVLHLEVALAALDAGCHVFIEKPPCRTAAEAAQILSTARRNNRHVMVGFQKRFATGLELAKELVGRPEFGPIYQYLAKFTTGSYKIEDRFIPHHVIHHLDLARFFLGEIEEIYTRAIRAAPGQVGYDVSLKATGGAIGTIQLSSLHDWTYPNERVEISGQGRVIIVDNLIDVTYHRPIERRPILDSGRLDQTSSAMTWRPNMTASVLMSHRGYEGEVAHFVNAILRDESPKPDIADGVKTMELLEAFRRSIQSSSAITVSEASA